MGERDSDWPVDWSYRLSGRGRADLKRAPCSVIEQHINLSDRIGTLNRLADAFEERCYDTVIVHGEKARSEFRHKAFSFLKETTNVFIPRAPSSIMC